MIEFGPNDTFELVVEKGDNLVAADLCGKSDPYVKILFNECFDRKTQIRKKTLNPVWNEIIMFYHIHTNSSFLTLSFKVYDWDRFSKDVSVL